jgi:hypothetical protein
LIHILSKKASTCREGWKFKKKAIELIVPALWIELLHGNCIKIMFPARRGSIADV